MNHTEGNEMSNRTLHYNLLPFPCHSCTFDIAVEDFLFPNKLSNIWDSVTKKKKCVP